MHFRTLCALLFFGVVSLFSQVPAFKANIDSAQLKALQAKGAVVIDIRTAPEWQETGVIRGSRMITFFRPDGSYDIDGFMQGFSRVVSDKSRPVVIICRTGNRSVPVADYLARAGYLNVYNQKRGIVEWIGLGWPTVKP
jgi:rhodanese-related sulfurtransferase